MGLFDAIGGVLGFSKGDAGAGASRSGLEAFSSIKTPNIEDLIYKLDQLVYQGDLTPEEAKTVLQDPSVYNSINTDPTARAAQLQALAGLQDIAKEDSGLTSLDLSNLNEIQSKIGQQERGARDAILMNAQERGLGGSGLELANLLLNNQNSATGARTQGLNVSSMAQSRALEALTRAGELGGDIQSQQFKEAADKAAAQDAINRFNTQNMQNVINQNVAARNQAAGTNLQNRQNISNQNVGLTNQQRQISADAYQQNYQNQLNKASGMAGQYANIAQGQRAAQDRQNAATGSLLNTAGMIGGAYLMSDKNNKKDIQTSDSSVEDFLNSLNPKSFRYKNKNQFGASDGENYGVMAQDVEKTPVGKTMVKNTPDGKMLDMQKGFGVILAALAALNDKIESERED